MAGVLSDVPWGNLWRWVVSTWLFVLVVGLPLAFVTDLDGAVAGWFRPVLIVVSAIVAAIVVWSDGVRWPGDPDT